MSSLNLFEQPVYTEIITRLDALKPDAVRQWGKMDIAQMLAHCSKAFRVPLSEKPLKPLYAIRLIAWAFKSSLHNDKPWKHGLPTSPEFVIKDERDFELEKAKLKGLIQQFFEAGPGKAGKYPHPAFGKFTPEQWGKMMWKHLDHHFRQFAS